MTRKLLLLASAALLTVTLSCSRESPTIPPLETFQSTTTSLQGTADVQAFMAYPQVGDTNIPVDAPIVIVFSEEIDDATVATATGNVTINGSLTGPIPYIDPVGDGRVMTFSPTVTYNPLEDITVTLSTGIQTPPPPPVKSLEWPPTTVIPPWTFTVGTTYTGDIAPEVIPGTPYPADLSTNISTSLPYVEVTFTKPVLGVGAASFTITGGVAAGAPFNPSGNTWRINLNPLAYGTGYTVALDCTAITDSSLQQLTDTDPPTNNIYNWTFTTVSDVPNPANIDSVRVISVSNTTAVIEFTTDEPKDITDCFVQYDTTTGAFGSSQVEVNWDGGSTLHSYHQVSLAGLTENTLYYFRVWVDFDSSGLPPGGLETTAESTFVTTSTAGVANNVLTDAANNQSAFDVVQNDDGSSYVFWINNNASVWGQHFDTGGGEQWGAGTGSSIRNGNTFTVTSGNYSTNNDVIVIVEDGNALYGRLIPDGGGPGDTWAGTVDLSTTVDLDSTFSAALTHERPSLIVSGTTEMPAGGGPANLIFDKDNDFSTLTLADNDLVIWEEPAGTWNRFFIPNTDSWNLFNFVINTEPAPTGTDLEARAYFLADQTPLGGPFPSGIVDTLTVNPDEFEADETFMPSITVGDNINCNGALTTTVSGTLDLGLGVYQITTTVNHLMAVGDTFLITPPAAGTVDSIFDADEFDVDETVVPYVSIISPGDVIDCNGALWTTVVSNTFVAGTIYRIQTTANHGMAAGDSFNTYAPGTVDNVPAANQFDADETYMGTINQGDTVNCNGTWAIVSGTVNIGGNVWRITTNINHGMAVTNPFWVYPRIGALAGYTSEAISNPLWDNDGGLNPGVTVFENDIVLNTTDITKTEVADPTGTFSEENDYAIQLDDDFFDDSENYEIWRLPSAGLPTYLAYGRSTGTSQHQLFDDTYVDFAVSGITTGDVAYNIANGRSAEVTSRVDADTLNLSADIFNAANQEYLIYRGKAFMVAYISGGDVMGRLFDLDTGATLEGTDFPIYNGGGCGNPVAVSDGAGNVFVFYENGGNIRGKKIYRDPDAGSTTFIWGGAAGVNGTNYGAGNLMQVLPDRSSAGTGESGVYLLTYDGATNISLRRINTGTGVTDWIRNFTGYNPTIAVDRESNGSRAIIAYTPTHLSGGNTYRHVTMQGINYDNTNSFASTNVTDNTAAYNCEYPSIAVSDTSLTAENTFYITWFDGRYYSSAGYALFAQRFDANGTKSTAGNWSNVLGEELFYGSATSYGLVGELYCKTLVYDDDAGTPPFGIIPIWYDFRNSGATGIDIYYEDILDDGTF